MRIASIPLLGIFLMSVALLSLGASAWAQPVSVTFRDGLISIQCSDAPLSSVFESIEREAGVELTLEDGVKTKTLTANLTDVPVPMAVQRLLEGVGVNYVVMMDPRDWGRVGKIFVGAGGGGPARSAQLPPAPEPVEEMYDTYEDPAALEGIDGIEGMENFDNLDPEAMQDPGFEDPMQNPDEFVDPGQMDPGFANPPGSSPIPEFLPPEQSFPRSSFSPGSSSRQRQQQPGQMQPQQPQNQAPPPAMFPFTDPFGRPIPIPPGMNPQQNDPNQQQQPQRPQPQNPNER